MPDYTPRKRRHWPYMLMAASAASLILAFGLCVAGFQNGHNLQSFATASILLFIVSGLAFAASIVAVIISLFNK